MHKSLASFATLLACLAGASVALAQPANNDCASAIPVLNNSVTAFDMTTATRDGVASCSNSTAARDIWYAYVASGSELVTLDLCDSPGTTTKGIAVYTGACGSTTQIACSRSSTDCGTGRPRVVFQATAGTYLINVHILSTSGPQTGVLNVHAVPYPLSNDSCAAPATVSEGNNFVAVWDASLDASAPCEIPSNTGAPMVTADTWYTYTAPSTGIRNFEVTRFSSAQNDTVLTMYDACGGAVLACDEYGGANHLSKFYHYPVTAGTTYLLRLASKVNSGSTNGVGNLSIAPPPAPATFDACSLAVPVAGQTSVPFDLAGLTTDARPTDCENFRKDGWFAWTPSATGIGIISACAAPTMSITVHDSCEALPNLCNESAFQPPVCVQRFAQKVNAGQTYYVRIGTLTNWRESSGVLDFAVEAPTEFYSEPAGAIAEPGNCTDAPSADLNGGCDLPVPAYTPLSLCQTRRGTASSRLEPIIPDRFNRIGFMTPTADSDWYEFTLETDQAVTITGQTEFAFDIRIVFSCPATNIATLPLASPRVSGVYPFTLTTPTLVPGTYALYIAPRGTGNSAGSCGSGDRYWFTITGSEPCPPADVLCCRGTTCVSVPAGSCAGSAGGTAATVVSACGAGGASATCCYADYDKANGRTIDDIFIYLNAWFANSPFTKVGGDGVQTRTIDDIFLFLAAWFQGCN